MAAYTGPDPTAPAWGTIARFDSTSAPQTLAADQFSPTGLALARGHAIWEADGVIRAVPLGGGEVVDIDGQPLGLTDPPAILDDDIAVDADAVYQFDGDVLYRVPLPF